LVVSFSPGFWRNILNLPVSHGRQPAQNVAEVSVGFDPVAPAVLNDRVDDRATFSRGGVSEKKPILFSESGRSEGSVATLQELRGRLARCSCWPLRFVVYSSGANLNRRSSCLRLAGTCAFRCPIVMWRNSLPSAAFSSTTSPSGGGSNVTPRKFSADCRRDSDRPTTVGGWMRPISG
jgi:hypothetical protein